ncbi:putative rlpA-like protein, double-psi beta-barrel [Rosa chinensis]|uniref:Putative rlpA-like protein, double-psi beta-barrel n=1 Tax=Rosa chinensis TaxID=74649 RepID=A0A2P6SGU7_ROSCH|nr:putative ripening-related protein 1 [Rosa chinensis]PRQ57915.1 putative rlpA-like protein, double-psi beta-barrel [Rosa chinensis]
MKYRFCSSGAFLLIFIILVTICLCIEARTYNPSGKIVGKMPPMSAHTKATLTINSFEKGGGGGGPSECDGKYHSDNTLIVALSTRWYNNGKRCSNYITIYGKGKSVRAKVVDECDSTRGCDDDIVDASKAVWKALGVKESSSDWGEMKIFWSDA